jgi:hypothetical protein
MDREELEKQKIATEHYISECAVNITFQRAAVDQLEREGRCSKHARAYLRTLLDSKRAAERDRARYIKKLKRGRWLWRVST